MDGVVQFIHLYRFATVYYYSSKVPILLLQLLQVRSTGPALHHKRFRRTERQLSTRGWDKPVGGFEIKSCARTCR